MQHESEAVTVQFPGYSLSGFAEEAELFHTDKMDVPTSPARLRQQLPRRDKRAARLSTHNQPPIGKQRESSYELLREDMIRFDDDIGMPDMSYGWAKLTCEYLARLAYEKHGLKSVCYRPFSGYGEDQDDSYPFPSICKRAIAHMGQPTLTVWGTGDQMRDFIHIEDCVDGVLTTMDKIDDGDALNLSTGIYTSFKQFARMAAEECGYEPEVIGLSDKPSGVFARGGDTKKQESLGFETNVDFRTGIKRALKIFCEHSVDSAT